MRSIMVMIILSVSAGALPVAADAHGCIKGAAVGGVAGHVAGHHAVAGAAIGCAVGHHRAKVHEKQAQALFTRKHRARRKPRPLRHTNEPLERWRVPRRQVSPSHGVTQGGYISTSRACFRAFTGLHL